MSVDQRLREAFRAEDDWAPEVSLTEVRAQARRGTAVRRTTLAAAAAVLVGGTAVAVGVNDRGGRADPVVPPPTVSPSPSTLAPAIEGTWLTPPFSEARVRRTLSRAGLGDSSDAVLADLKLGGFNRFLVRIEGGFVDTWIVHSDQEDDERVDRQTYQVDGDRLVLVPREAGGSSVFAWVVEGSRLKLRFVSTTEADSDDGIPAEAYLRAVYTSVWFTPTS